MLIKDEVLQKIVSGEITILFRRWKRRGAKAGGTQMTQIGLIGIDSVDVISEDAVTDADAIAAGHTNRAELLEHLNYCEDEIYRVGVHFAGDDPRIALREKTDFDEVELAEIIRKLDKFDSHGNRGAWTQSYLEVIDAMPATYSGLLANYIGVTKEDFKPLVRKLKNLGLTESLKIGYQLSPRGTKVLAVLQTK